MQFTHGMPNNSEFFQSRMNAGNNMANVTLWDQEKVAPGLNLNYNEMPNLGFNNGISAREAWQPKTVDEMRVATNPKCHIHYLDMRVLLIIYKRNGINW